MKNDLVELSSLEDQTQPLGPQSRLFGDDDALLRVVFAVGVALTLWKAVIAFTGNVIWEEGHFAVLGQHLDIAYPDVPAGWPLFARLCTTVFGWSPLAIRLPGLAVAQAIPFGIYYLASAVVSRREALWAALICMLVPALGASGTIFYPECALQLLLALMLGAIIRGMRDDNRLGQWVLAGACGGLGLFIHFRFVLAGAGVALFFLAAPMGWRQLKKPGVWIAAVLAALGLLPGLIYNLREHWPAIAYQVANRPNWKPQPGLLLSFLEQQFGACLPAFGVAFAVSGWREWKVSRTGDGPSALLLITATATFGVFLVLSPFDKEIMPHWPFMAYVALIPFAPSVLIGFADRAQSWAARRRRKLMITAFGPIFSILAALAGTAFEEGWSHAAALPSSLKPLLFTRLEDWRALNIPLAKTLTIAGARFPSQTPVIASAGHIPALKLEFPGVGRRSVYALDEPYDEFTRFSVLRRAWGLNETGLRRSHAGAGVALVLPEPSYLYNSPPEAAFRRRLCAEFDGIEPAGVTELAPGKVAVEFYTARVRPLEGAVTRPGWLRATLGGGCALFPRLYLAQPTRGAMFKAGSPSPSFFGVASDPLGVTAVDALLDGKPAARALYGEDPTASPPPPELADDPNYPKLWFNVTLPASVMSKGEHRLALRITRTDGSTLNGPARSLFVR